MHAGSGSSDARDYASRGRVAGRTDSDPAKSKNTARVANRMSVRAALVNCRQIVRRKNVKFRCGAAILLSGWYLMIPPKFYPRSALSPVDVKAPPEKWQKWHPRPYASEDECEAARKRDCGDWLTQHVPFHWPVQSILGTAA